MERHIKNSINFFWIGDELSPVELLSLRSCMKNNMLPILWTYNEIRNIPSYVTSKDANLILAKEKADHYINTLKLPIPSVSDLFRYELLYREGGIYSDTDIIFIKDLYTLGKEEYFASTFEYIYGECATNCLIKLKKKSEVALFLKEEANKRLDNYINSDRQMFDYCSLGPFVVQECTRKMNIEVLSYDVINPISWRWTDKLIAFIKPDYKFFLKNAIRRLLPAKVEKRGYSLTKNTYAVHLCNEIWKQRGINKFQKLHNSSLYEQLRKRY